MTIITWKIDNLECIPATGQYTDIVHNIYWRLFASDQDVSTSIYGCVAVVLSQDNVEFIPFDDLTEEVVLSWVHSSMGADTIAEKETIVAQQLDHILSPPLIDKPLPWEA